MSARCELMLHILNNKGLPPHPQYFIKGCKLLGLANHLSIHCAKWHSDSARQMFLLSCGGCFNCQEILVAYMVFSIVGRVHARHISFGFGFPLFLSCASDFLVLM